MIVDDVLIAVLNNARVAEVVEAMPPIKTRASKIDRFQCQEAVLVIYSMTSTPDALLRIYGRHCLECL